MQALSKGISVEDWEGKIRCRGCGAELKLKADDIKYQTLSICVSGADITNTGCASGPESLVYGATCGECGSMNNFEYTNLRLPFHVKAYVFGKYMQNAANKNKAAKNKRLIFACIVFLVFTIIVIFLR